MTGDGLVSSHESIVAYKIGTRRARFFYAALPTRPLRQDVCATARPELALVNAPNRLVGSTAHLACAAAAMRVPVAPR